MFGPLLEVEMWKKCTPLWHEAHFKVKMYKILQLRSTFRRCDVEQVHAVVARSRFRSQNVKNARGLEPQIFGFAEMILRDRCSTPYDLASIFRGRRTTLDRWSGKIAKRIGTRPSAQHSTFHF